MPLVESGHPELRREEIDLWVQEKGHQLNWTATVSDGMANVTPATPRAVGVCRFCLGTMVILTSNWAEGDLGYFTCNEYSARRRALWESDHGPS